MKKTQHEDRGGFTLLEIVLATSLFALGSGAALSAVVGAHYLSRTAREESVAMQAAQSMLERIRGEPFGAAFVNFSDAGVPGGDFAVRGLNVQSADPDGFCGRVTFPGDGIALLEDSNDRELGMPRDLNLDDVVDNFDHSGDYAVLPVRVTVAWRGALGDRQLSVSTTLVETE